MNIDYISEDILNFIKVGISENVSLTENVNNNFERIYLERNYKTYLEDKFISEKKLIIMFEKEFINKCLDILLNDSEKRSDEELIDYGKEIFESITNSNLLTLSFNSISKYKYILSSEINVLKEIFEVNFNIFSINLEGESFNIYISSENNIEEENTFSGIEDELDAIDEKDLDTLFNKEEKKESIFSDYFPEKENELLEGVEEILNKTEGMDLGDTLKEIDKIIDTEYSNVLEKIEKKGKKEYLTDKEIDTLLNIAEEFCDEKEQEENLKNILDIAFSNSDELEINNAFKIESKNNMTYPRMEIRFNFNGLYLTRVDTEEMLSKAIILEEIKVPVYINFNGIMNKTSLTAIMSKQGIISIE